jgi:alkylation response protein AidB-like acyl-CoA dehydrogenase
MAIDAEDRAALREAVRGAATAGPRDFLDEAGTPQRDGRLWKVLTDQMGIAALLLGEEEGGAGAGVAEVALVLEQLAASLAVVPALSSLGMATALLRVADTSEAAALLSEMASGAVTAAVAWPAPESYSVAPALVGVGVGAPAPGSSIVVSGTAAFVLDGLDSDVLLAPASCDGVQALVSVEASDLWVQRIAMGAMDLTRGVASCTFTEAPATVLGVDVDVQAALDISLTLVAAEQVGVAQRCHDTAVAWAKERVQFDRPIGQFQAIKHQLVDLLMALEMARSSLDLAVAAADGYLMEPTPENARALSIAASVAKARCGDAATLVSDESLHILGGIGFTWEHDAHLYFRRAKTLEVFLGTPAAHRRRFSTMLLEAAASV